MDMAINFFKWCTILNAILLFFSAIIIRLAPDVIYRMQSRWIPVSREVFNIAIYSYLGLFKIFFIVFNLVPFLALEIVVNKLL